MTAPVRPSIGRSLRVARLAATDLHGALADLAELGDVVDVGWGPQRFVYAFGAEANETILSSHADHFSWHDFLQTLVPVDGETALVVSDGDDHARRRRVVQPAFHRRRIDGYVATMSEEVTRTVGEWTEGETVELHTAMRACIRRIVMRTLFGDDFATQATQFGDHLEPALVYINRPPWRRVDRRWFPPYRTAMAARDAADRLVYAEIARRRGAPADQERNDVLSWLLEAQEGEAALSDVEVRDQVVSLVAAGYDTTAAAAAWMSHALLSRPEVLADLRAEIERVLPDGAPVDAVALQQMHWLDGVVSESLRLWPPGAVSGRRVERDVEVCGRTVPAGRMIMYSPWITQRDPRWWPDPLEFEPGRWVEGHPAHRRIAPSSWVVFGGGARRCLGFAMAITELKVIAIHLARDVDLRVVGAVPAPTGLATTVPAGGVHAMVGRR